MGAGGAHSHHSRKWDTTWRFDSSQSLGFCSARDQLTTPKRLKTGYHPSVLKTRLQVIPYHQWVHRAASLSRSPRPGARQLSLRRRPPTGGVDQAGGLLPLPRPPEWPGLLPNRNVDHSTTWAQPPPSLLTPPRKATSPLRERIGRGWGQNRSSPCVRHRRMTHLQQPVPTGNTGGGRRALPTRPAAVGLSLPLSEPWLRADLVPSPPPALRFPSFRLECLRRAFAGRPAPQARARPAVTPGPGTAPRTGTARARQARLSESKPAQCAATQGLLSAAPWRGRLAMLTGGCHARCRARPDRGRHHSNSKAHLLQSLCANVHATVYSY